MLRHEAWQHLSIDRILQRRPRGTRLGCASGSIMYCLGVYLIYNMYMYYIYIYMYLNIQIYNRSARRGRTSCRCSCSHDS